MREVTLTATRSVGAALAAAVLAAIFVSGCEGDASGRCAVSGDCARGALCVSGACVPAGADAAVGDAGGPTDATAALDGASPGVSVTFTPTTIAPSTGDLANAMRGQYRWLGVDPYPADRVANDSYSRWNWDSFEPTRGNYDWSMIDRELAAARARHGRWGLRLMPLCQGCPGHTYLGAGSSLPDDLADVANVLVAAPPGETERYVIPDWNSDAYLSRLEEVLQAIGTRYRDDPYFGFVDVSGYGNWGEMHLWPFSQPGGPYDTSAQQPITDANAVRLLAATTSAFPNKIIVANPGQRAVLAAAVASTSPPVGLRVDCLGADGLGGGDVLSAVAGAMDRWRTAPFITEWCQTNIGSSGANLFVQGEMQVRDYHVSMLSSGNFASPPTTPDEVAAFRSANVEAGYRLRASRVALRFDLARPTLLDVDTSWSDDGVAPTYLAWRVVLGVSGPVSAEVPLTVDLRDAQPGAPLEAHETVTLPTLSAGRYDVYVRVEDVQAVSLPMSLAMEGREEPSGNYALGSLTVP